MLPRGWQRARRQSRHPPLSPSTSRIAIQHHAAPLRPAACIPPQKNYVEPARRIGEGSRRFGQAFFGPLKHVSGTLWLEITGLFFALFALFFGQNAWKTRLSALHGPEHTHFLVYALVTLVFLYFSASSFLKAARRGRRDIGRRAQ